MKTSYNNLTVEVISSAQALWNYLAQVCPVGISPSFVMDQTERAGP